MSDNFNDYMETESAKIREALEAKGAKVKEPSIKKRVARNFLKDFYSASKEELPEAITEAMGILFGTPVRSGYSVSSPRAIIRNKVKEAILENGSVSEQDVFTLSLEAGSAWGRSEMKKAIKDFINVEPVEDRLWVALEVSADSPIGTYVLQGSGADAPEGWNGYVPANVEIDL